MPAIPNAQPYSGNNNFIPSIIGIEPSEGRKSIPYLINWNRPLAAGLDTVSFNPQGNSPLDFRQICGLIVDNSQCGASLDFIFPDTDVTISIPAYAPYTVLQVNSRAVQFYVQGNGVLSSDKTSFAILNYSPAPVAVPTSQEQQSAFVQEILANTSSTTIIVPIGITGTLEGVSVTYSSQTEVNSASQVITLEDTVNNLLIGRVSVNSASVGTNIRPLFFENVALRFRNGLRLQLAPPSLPLNGVYSVNVLYRTP